MTRIPCGQCGKPLRAAANADVPAPLCRQCRQAQAEQPTGAHSAASLTDTRGPGRAVVFGLAGVAVLLLGLAAAGGWFAPAISLTAVVGLAAVYGHVTGCPSCGWWLSRVEVGRECRDHRTTSYACRWCRHRWAVEEDE
jgi:hypothetical protein